ncbi:hypothetical protein W01_01240 [Candidatus Nitrotoga sp. AM1P]|nr:hypothetical protein W01_01240 [Candidatus Nitrotoga sp. AM1P]
MGDRTMNDHNATPSAVCKTADPIHLKNSGKPNDPDISIFILPKDSTGIEMNCGCLIVYDKLIFGEFDKWKRDTLQVAS